jgi:hypothetical protein
MFNRKTVFVLGAGTSFEIGFPVGNGLRDRMIGLLDIAYDGWEQQTGDRAIVEAVKRHCRTPEGRQGDINPYLHAGWQIRDGMPLAISIDNFLEAHSGDKYVELMGKLGIARAILECESASPLAIHQNRRRIDTSSLSSTWYGGFARALTEGVSKSSLDKIFDNLTVITFNYDRSVEQFLAHALAIYYQEPLERTQALVARAEIFHPYGTVGRLPWQRGEGASVPYGGGGDLLGVIPQIKTFTESLGGEAPVAQMHEALRAADQIIFLGFAYHRQNLQLLKPPGGIPHHFMRVLGTSLGISGSDLEIIRRELAKLLEYQTADGPLYNENFRSEAMTCAEFMSANHRTITA